MHTAQQQFDSRLPTFGSVVIDKFVQGDVDGATAEPILRRLFPSGRLELEIDHDTAVRV